MPMDVLDCVHRPASGTVAVRIVLEVGLEDRFQHDLGGRLNHPIANGWNAERTLAFAIRFWDHHTPHRIGPIRLRDQFLAQACQPPFQAPLLDLRESYSVNARSTRIGAGRPVGVVQNVLAADLVVEHVEAESRLRLRLAIQLPLKVPDLIWCYRAHRQSPSPRYLRKRTRSQGPLLRRHYPASTLQRPCPTPAEAATRGDVEAATLAYNGSPLTTTTLPTCCAHYPGGSSRCACRLLPYLCSLPQMAGGSASALSLSRPAQALRVLRPARSLSRPRRPLSRGS